MGYPHPVRPDLRVPSPQGGPRRLWEQELALYARWRALGRPGRERLGLSVPADGGPQEVWLDHPGAEDRWPLAGWEPETGTARPVSR